MSSGIFFPIAAIAASASSQITITNELGSSSTNVPTVNGGPWTPPQYSQPALTMLTVPATGSPSLVSAPVTSPNGTVAAPVYQGGVPSTSYVFDAVLKLSHRRSLVKTQHPVLTGANISDHYYLKPSRVVLEIGMSDAMAAFTAGVWVGASTKSISAWQILKGLQLNGTLLTVTTRLDTYYNMLIDDLNTSDDNKTLHGLRATVTLEELISASVSSQSPSSARSQTTDSTSSGTIQSTAPNPAQVQQNVIPSTLWPDTPTFSNIPGSMPVSSNNLGQIPTE